MLLCSQPCRASEMIRSFEFVVLQMFDMQLDFMAVHVVSGTAICSLDHPQLNWVLSKYILF